MNEKPPKEKSPKTFATRKESLEMLSVAKKQEHRKKKITCRINRNTVILVDKQPTQKLQEQYNEKVRQRFLEATGLKK